MKAILVALLACVMVPALALAQEGQAPGNLNTITAVNVTGGRVEIVGTRKPNFTTFTMTDPPRLVIDISEAVFSGVKEELAVGNGTITGIRTASYGSDESSIARVLIGYEREVETDIQAAGNSLVVTIAGGGGAAVAERPGAAQGTAPAGTAPAGTAPAAAATPPGTTAEQAAVAARTDRQQQEKAAAQATAAAQADPRQQEKAVAQATAAAQTDRQQQEKAAAQATAAAQADAEARRQAEARAVADRKAQEEAARVAAQQAKEAEQRRLQEERAAKEAAAVAEKQRQQDEARAAAAEKQRQQADEKARREAEAQAAATEKKRQQDEARAAAEEKKRQAAEEREAKLEEARAAAEERRAAAEEKKRQQAEARQTRVAQAETPRREPEQGDSAGGSSRSKVMTLVGFQPARARVFVRTNEPVRYNVTEGNKEVVLELENTRISESNNTRSLNTSFFDTAVASVNADAGPSRTVRVAIKLKEQVSFETRQEGNEVFIEFQRPSRR
ncbi:MAG TPA: AMIN domain-containing protein [Archangium sp.]|uniref:AMIN domain-containing protein n=1 Tax=Archangium sp. TaxID=1872627 RepID=UPI002E3722FC|nr:AMIN domain-containing protein [Archangium sp.]HEX5746394.1 AMIN domain-containing protein [Archangium sp.]